MQTARLYLFSVFFIVLYSNFIEAEETPEIMVVEAMSGLRLRYAPDLDSVVLLTIPNGAPVKVLRKKKKAIQVSGKTGVWVKVSYGDLEGWVFGGYLKAYHVQPGVFRELLQILNSPDFSRKNENGSQTHDTYRFIDRCTFAQHTQWTSLTHADISDAVVSLNEVYAETETSENDLYLILKCNNGRECVAISGENTGEAYTSTFPYLLIDEGTGAAAADLEKLNALFHEAIFQCSQ